MLNQHIADYREQLEALLKQMGEEDPLRDNVLLAQMKLISDEQLRAEQFYSLHKKFQNTDGSMQALYEFANLKKKFWQQCEDSNLELKKKYLTETRAALTDFISLYPYSIYTDQAVKNLANLPTVE